MAAEMNNETATQWRSYRIGKFGAPLELQCEELPSIRGTEVLIKISACGVCHSDLHIADGYFDLGNGRRTPIGRGEKGLPFTPGHEIVGEVVALGDDPGDLAIGRRGVVYPWIGCGKQDCYLCARGDEHMCGARTIGVMKHGGFSSHVVVPHSRYIVSFSGIPESVAATYACSGLTAFGSLKKIGKLREADPLLIIGAGGVGLAAIGLAKEVVGVAPIVAEIDATKAQAALAAGAASVIDPSASGAARDFVKTTGGAAAVVDFVGSESSTKFAVSAARRTGKVLIVGLFGGSFQMPVSFFPLLGLTVEGTQVGTLEQLRELIALGQLGRFNAIPVAGRPLAEANQVLADLRESRIVGRAVLVV
jgi:D-arabinose 1-dehydrogenase-like Zn-dependent alcohol dehydrogenase